MPDDIPADLIRCKSDEVAIEQGCYYDDTEPQKVKRFVESKCVQSKSPWRGEPIKLLPWQWDRLIRPLYGWRQADGTRRFSWASVWIPKKQGKSTLASAIANYELLSTPGCLVLAIAADVRQAGIVYGEAAAMLELGLPEHASRLKRDKPRLWIRSNIKTIEDTCSGSSLQVLSSSPESAGGHNAKVVIYDELALWGSNARQVWDQLYAATAAQPNSLQLVISTAQFDRSHIGYEQYRLAKRVADSEIVDTTLLPVIYEVAEHDDWRDPETWRAANPSYDVTVPASSWSDEYAKTQNNPTAEASFRTLRLNQWVGSSQQWIASNVWAAGLDQTKTLDDCAGMPAYIGVDLARKGDLASYVVCCIDEATDDRPYDLVWTFPRFYLPAAHIEKKEKRDNQPYRQHAENGHITLTPGDTIDFAYIADDIRRDAETVDLIELRYDPFWADHLTGRLESDGIDCVEVSQVGRAMSAPLAEFERLCLAGHIRHDGNPLQTWCLGNCQIHQTPDDQLQLRKGKQVARIDGITALCVGLSGVMQHDGPGDYMMPMWA